MESIRELIEQRAYLLYLKHGKVNGHHEEDWQQAEKEIRAELDAKKKSEARSVSPAPKAEVKAEVLPQTKAPVAPAAPVKPTLEKKTAPAAASVSPAAVPRTAARSSAPVKPAVRTSRKKK
jgi:lysozyme family protein